jgi:hypothetical protein
VGYKRLGVIPLLIPALGIQAGLCALRMISDIRDHIPETIILLLVTTIFYIVSSFLVLAKLNKSRGLEAPSQPDATTLAFIVVCALTFRLTVWPLYPALSDDVFRYRWEGKLQAQGGNPYQVRPNDQAWEVLRDAAFPMVVAKDFKAGYGPLTEILELATYRAVAWFTPDAFVQAFWFKLPAALCDLGIIAALLALLAAHRLSLERVLVYAWCPLPIMEFWATGHTDALAVLLVLLALLAAARGRWTWSFLFLTLGAAAKLWPLALFPAFLFRGRRFRPLIPSLAVALLLAGPHWSPVSENARFMTGFVGGWRNNDSLFALLLWIVCGNEYRAKLLAFGCIALVTLYASCRRWTLERAAIVTIVGILMFSSNSHPWYLTWLLPLLPFWPAPFLFLWLALSPLAYHVLIDWVSLGVWNHEGPLRYLIYIPVYGLMAASAVIGALSRRRWRT